LRSSCNNTVLHLALAHDYSRHIPHDFTTRWYWTPPRLAQYAGNKATYKITLQLLHHADLAEKNSAGVSPLQLIMQECIECLDKSSRKEYDWIRATRPLNGQARPKKGCPARLGRILLSLVELNLLTLHSG
jgi:hypothetical protein